MQKLNKLLFCFQWELLIFSGAPTLSASANEFVPGENRRNDSIIAKTPGQFEMDTAEEEEQQHASLIILYEAMVQLTVEPGRFDSIARRLTEDLNMVLEGKILHS